MSIARRNYGKNHGYTIDGVKAIGVTTAIGQGIPKPALPYWSARVVAEFVADSHPDDLDVLRRLGRDGMINALKQTPWTKRDNAAVRGTDVHNIAEKLINGEAVDVPDHLTSHVTSAVKFMDDWQVRPVLVEKVVASRQWGYAGTLDLVADTPGGKRILFDYKTSASGIWPETAVQLAAYRHADCYLGDDGTEIPMTEVGVDECAAVWVRADGYDVVPLDAGEKQFKFFLHALWLARNGGDQMKEWVKPFAAPPQAA